MRAMEVQPDDYRVGNLHLAVIRGPGQYGGRGQIWSHRLKRAEQALRQNPENSRSAQLIANAYAFLGESNRAKEWIKRAFEIDPDDNHVRYNSACVYALLGEFDKAFDLLETWVHRAAPDSKLWFLNDPDFTALRQHPRYEELMAKVKSTDKPN